MKKQQGYTVTVLLLIILTLVGATGWGLNIYKLTQCNFESPYKCEVLRVIGLIPPIGAVMGYVNISDTEE
jgi:hypothetical protein